MKIKWYKISVAMINGLFRSAIASLVSDSLSTTLLSKQMAIRKLHKKVMEFMSKQQYSEFEIQVLSVDAADEDNPILTLKVKNFEFFDPNHKPRLFKLVIQPDWETINVYQASITGKWLKENV